LKIAVLLRNFFFGFFMIRYEKQCITLIWVILTCDFFEVKTPILVEKIGNFYFWGKKCVFSLKFFISAYYWSTKIGEMVTNGKIFSWA